MKSLGGHDASRSADQPPVAIGCERSHLARHGPHQSQSCKERDGVEGTLLPGLPPDPHRFRLEPGIASKAPDCLASIPAQPEFSDWPDHICPVQSDIAKEALIRLDDNLMGLLAHFSFAWHFSHLHLERTSRIHLLVFLLFVQRIVIMTAIRFGNDDGVSP